MAGNTVTLEFAGDADKLTRASKQATKATDDVGKSAKDSGEDFKKSAKESGDFTTKIGLLGAGVEGISGAFDTAAGAVSSFADLQNQGAEKASQMKRALLDVEQAQEDYSQALRDGKQAAIDADQAQVDLKQALLDQATAQTDYNKAVKEHGKNSVEAQQAAIDLAQAGVDVKQAQEDSAQALRDNAQAGIDAKTATQDLSDAQRELHPTDLSKFADQAERWAPLLSGLVGITGLVTAAQWAWNAAQLASPLTWIILAVIALVAVIVLIATKTDWFQKAWKWAWGGIKDAAAAVGSWFKDTLWGKWIKGSWDAIKNKAVDVWDWMKGLPGRLKSAFAAVGGFISAPFRAAFNFISDAWNNTIGRLHWSVPGWVPGIGGASISVPNLPHFHTGGVVPGPAGSEMLAVLQAGETVIPASGAGAEMAAVTVMLDGDVLIEAIAKLVRRRGGNAQLVLGGRNA